MPTSPAFGEYLTKVMDTAGLSVADLSRLTGQADSLISKWRIGRAVPTIPNLRLLAPALRIRPMELYVAAGHILPEEADMAAMPEPPETAVTLEGEVMMQNWLPDEVKHAMVTLLGEFRNNRDQRPSRSNRSDKANRG